jgi:DNA-binding HxlR family transcriptional regulator
MRTGGFDTLLIYLDGRTTGPERERLTALANRIGESGNNRGDPVREIMSRLGDNWSPLVISILATGRYRHAALRRIIAALSAERAISQRMLTLRLRALERDGIVGRDIEETAPPTVTYFLTPLGLALWNQLEGMIQWIKDNEAAIFEARVAFEKDARA